MCIIGISIVIIMIFLSFFFLHTMMKNQGDGSLSFAITLRRGVSWLIVENSKNDQRKIKTAKNNITKQIYCLSDRMIKMECPKRLTYFYFHLTFDRCFVISAMVDDARFNPPTDHDPCVCVCVAFLRATIIGEIVSCWWWFCFSPVARILLFDN